MTAVYCIYTFPFLHICVHNMYTHKYAYMRAYVSMHVLADLRTRQINTRLSENDEEFGGLGDDHDLR